MADVMAVVLNSTGAMLNVHNTAGVMADGRSRVDGTVRDRRADVMGARKAAETDARKAEADAIFKEAPPVNNKAAA